MIVLLAALGCGLLFGLGLIVSGMVHPAKILNFLDVAGTWDPSLAFVMAGGLIVTFAGYRMIFSQARKPLLEPSFFVPTRSDIDAPLIAGAAIFGIGWGIGGLCPGPAITAVTAGGAPVVIFLISMAVGLIGGRMLFARHHMRSVASEPLPDRST